jgi:streptomycin 6-kinase
VRRPPLRDPLPPGLLAFATRGEAWAAWLADLPGLVGELIAEWQLVADGESMHGACALVLPVRDAAGRPAVLKISWPHWEAETEHLALGQWRGEGAVELLRADPHRFALLLERAEPRDLSSIAVDDACTVIAERYDRLHVPAHPQLLPLSGRVRGWCDRLAALPRTAPLPHRFVERAVALGRALADDAATDGTLIHTDLHYANVLAARREPWLVIDPKPLSGDPHYEVPPLLNNRWAEAVATGDLRGAIRRRVDLVTDVAGLDRDRVRDWAVVRMMTNALWETEEAAGRGGEPSKTVLAACVAVAKAALD